MTFKELSVGDRFRFKWGGYVCIKTSARGYKLADYIGTVKRCCISVKVEDL